jgi:hypothetical protein
MAKTINPAFQAAPFLGESSHDPIEFQRRHNLAKYQMAKLRNDQIQENTAKGLSNLMLDLKGWEDQEGYKEIVADHDKVINAFLELSKKGLNLTSPKTSQELLAYKAITQKQQEIKQKVDTWNQQKGVYDMMKKTIEADAAKPSGDQRIDAEASYKNIQDVLKSNSIMDRNGKLQNMLVLKPEIGDVHKYVNDNMKFITQPEIITEPYNDPVTGQTISKTREVMSPENEKKREVDLRNLFKTAPEPVLNAVKATKAKDKTLDVMSDEDYFVSMYDPKYKEKMVDKLSGTGGGLNINFLGQKTTMSPGRQRKEPLNYGNQTFTSPYEFSSTKPIRVPLGAQGSEIFMGKDWSPLTGGGDVEATLSFYDSNTDKFIFRTTQAGAAPFVMNNMTIAVPRSVIGDQADDLPIEVNGKVEKLKDVYGSKKPEVKLIGGKSFVTPYIPKKR